MRGHESHEFPGSGDFDLLSESREMAQVNLPQKPAKVCAGVQRGNDGGGAFGGFRHGNELSSSMN
jgi:hypothetical protein